MKELMTSRKVNIMIDIDAIALRKLIEVGTSQYVSVKTTKDSINIWVNDYEGENIFATISQADYQDRFSSDPQILANDIITCYREHKGYA